MHYNGESKTVEYKQTYSKTLLKTVCAFANYHDGKIVIGVRDDHRVVGVQNVEELKLTIEHAINDAILPNPYYEFEVDMVEGMKVLVLDVYKGDHTPYTYQGKAYIRKDTSTVQADRASNQNLILSGRNLGYEDLPAPVGDLSFTYFEKLMKKAYKIGALSSDLLRTLGLLKEEIYNNAAALLSDENPIANGTIQLVAFSGTGVGKIKDRQTLSAMSILEQYDRCMAFFGKHINAGEIIDAAYRRTVEDVPYIAYREAVANMIVHRDYAAPVDARVEFFADRIEVVSPGGLPYGMLAEEYREGRLSRPRNRTLADIFLRLKIIEKLATGVRRIKEQYQHEAIKPAFKVSENAVVVVLPYVEESLPSGATEAFENSTVLEGNALKIYSIVKQYPGIKRGDIQKQITLEKSQTVARLKELREAGYIMRVGNGPATGYKTIDR